MEAETAVEETEEDTSLPLQYINKAISIEVAFLLFCNVKDFTNEETT